MSIAIETNTVAAPTRTSNGTPDLNHETLAEAAPGMDNARSDYQGRLLLQRLAMLETANDTNVTNPLTERFM